MKLTAGILAHVDAGKTTLSQRVLYEAHATRKLGRVDHGDAFLDTHPIERARGITVFSGQACIPMENGDTLYWLDTPGHADFSPQMERALSVLDAAILVISAADGVQSHAQTVWQLLRSYGVPCFIFMNKTDREGVDQEAVLAECKALLSPDVIDLRQWQHTGVMDDELIQELASRDETMLERLFDTGYDEALWTERLCQMVLQRQVFPLMSGSALQGVGVDSFMRLFLRLSRPANEPNPQGALSARVFRVRHDKDGMRLVFMKLLSGSIRVKDELPQGKVNGLRIYHGDRWRDTDRAEAGDLVAIPGLEGLMPGDVIGEGEPMTFRTEPMMAADLVWDSGAVPAFRMMEMVRQLQDEEPTLQAEQRQDVITVRVMGGIQLQILQELMKERFGLTVDFGPCRVLYRETVAAPTIGIGHYEPLRHYAEVHLRLVPTAPGSGVTFQSLAHVDDLALNWQRLIETHVFEKQHRGVLTGSPLTDVRVELLCGRAHLKHTEGGDFRQSVYRAIRQGLMRGNSVLLEPICGFELLVPGDLYGTISSALTRLHAQTDVQPENGGRMRFRGTAPYALFMPWQQDFTPMTHGRGSLRVWMDSYAPCRDQERIVEEKGYDPLADDTPDSVFCAHGAGFRVAWDHVEDFAHLSHEGL